ncbi:MAG: terminase family protein [Christensenellaceae bacterium]
MKIRIAYEPNKKQQMFHACGAQEVVYGGAKGGGKSCALVMECLAYGLENAGAEMYLFRESYDDLEANLIKEWKEKVPKEIYQYNESKHVATLLNGSVVKFRYVSNLTDAQSYQGRSMDFIGIDELTKHLEKSVQVLMSCLRSPKGFLPVFRGTCNPGGVGHTWVKKRYIDKTRQGELSYIDEITGNKVAFVRALVYDNDVLMKNDPAYVRRLENLPDAEKKAFLYGDWDIFEGQYFCEFKRDIHVVTPFEIPSHWRIYRTIDYGLDMLACLWIAVDERNYAYVYKECYESNLIIHDAAERIKQMTIEEIYATFAPPDLWSRGRDSGKTQAEVFKENGIDFFRASNNRIAGWLNVKEWLRPCKDEQGKSCAHLRIFSNCVNLIRTLPELQFDESNPNDCSTIPHEITHAPDALRYFCVSRPCAAQQQAERGGRAKLMFEIEPKRKAFGVGEKHSVF